MRLAIIVVAAGLAPVWGQEIKLPPSVEKLAEKAEESVVVTLDSKMLKLFAMFDTGVDADVRKLFGGLESVYVRSFQFAFEDEYKTADVEAMRSQLKTPEWSRIVGVRSKNRFRDGDGDGDVDVYFKDGGNGKLGGIVIISAAPRELTFVSIAGSIAPEHLADLGGQFHIPRLEMGLGGRKERK
jgi:hypothetical protein